MLQFNYNTDVNKNYKKNNNIRIVDSLVFEVIVHIGSLFPIQFSYELLILSYKHRLYLIHIVLILLRRKHFGILIPTPIIKDSR